MLHKSSVRMQWNGFRTSLVRNPFISPEIIDPKFVINMPVDAIASSRSIYATMLRATLVGQPPIKSDFRVTAYFFKENTQGHTQER
ncbi:MAG: hypothetical protein VB140_08155 [Burkholderia sp.]|nr:MAG: hypothetical protein E5299_01415 [Burkholderia gladioli]